MVRAAGDSGFIAWADAVDADGVADAAALAAHLADTVDAHDASAVSFVPAQGIAATTVQAAIEEVVTDAAATYPTLASGKCIALGDSIEIGSAASATSDAGLSIFSLICIKSNQRLRLVRNAGVAGDTTAQMLARIQTAVIDYAPDFCLIGGPTNDHGADVTEAVTRANYAAIVAALRSAGVTPVFRTAPPIDSVNNYKIEQHNVWLHEYCRTNGIALLDYYAALVDPTTGGPLAGLTSDGIHPNATGRGTVADYVLARLPDMFQSSVPLTASQADATNLLTGGTFAVDTNADGYADGWSLGGGTFTPSLVTDADVIGNWQQASIATTGLGYFQQQITTGWSPGDVLALGCLVDKAAGTSATIQLAPSTGDRIYALYEYAGALTGTCWNIGTVPQGATTLYCRVSMNYAAGAVKVARMTALNLTTLGLV